MVAYATIVRHPRRGQKREASPVDSAGHLIAATYRLFRAYLDRELASYGIGAAQLQFLMALYHGDGTNQETLAKLRCVDKATTTRAIAKLEREGLVRRERDPDDGRAYRVFLTEKARRLQPEFRRILNGWSNQLLAGFRQLERRRAIRMLNQMFENASAVDRTVTGGARP